MLQIGMLKADLELCNDHIWGNAAASIELIEYGDYECLYCGRAHLLIKSIQQKLGYNIKYVFRNFPSRSHPNAFSAAIATEAAALQNRYWKMHDLFFRNQKKLNDDNIFLMAGIIGLDMERFQNDIQQKYLLKKVEEDLDIGVANDVNKTPTFFINGSKYDGGWTGNKLFSYLKVLQRGLEFVMND